MRRSQKTEVRRQKSEDGRRKSGVGSRRLAVGSGESEVRSQKSEVGSRKSGVGSQKFLKPCFDVGHDAAGFDEFLAGVARADVKTFNLAAAFIGDGGVNGFLPLPDFDHTNLL